MTRASVVIDTDYRVGDIDPRLFGALLEHVGRSIYTGIYEPEHPTADEYGFRRDVEELLTDVGFPVYRYPGGCFVSAYRWEDGVGPREERPRRLNLPWRSVETNEIGTNEFVDWTRRLGAETLLVVNTATRNVLSAAALVEYCNHPGGSFYSDLRRSHGLKEPHAVRLWEIDNEQDGPWEIGFRTAADYGRVAFEAAKVMRRVDPTIEVVAGGSSGPELKTYPDWDRVVLEHAYGNVDYLAPHMYLGDFTDDLSDFLAQSIAFDEYLRVMEATCDIVRAKLGAKKRMQLCVDEWNVWYHTRDLEDLEGYLAGTDPDHHDTESIEPWALAPRLMEEVYTQADACVAGLMLIVLMRHAARVRIACISTAVNNVGAVMTEPGGPAWPQTIYYPLLHAARYGRGEVIQVSAKSDRYESSSFGDVPFLDAVATLDEDDATLTVFAVNRSREEQLALTALLRHRHGYHVLKHTILSASSPHAANTATAPNTVVPRDDGDGSIDDEQVLRATLPPLSWNVIRLAEREM